MPSPSSSAPAAPAPPPKRALLVDAHSVFRNGIRTLIEQHFPDTVCDEAADMNSALRSMRRSAPALAVIDLSLPGPDGLELIKSMTFEFPHLSVLVVSMHDESVYALRALRAGAKGYVGKQASLEEIQAALEKVMAGDLYVSARLRHMILHRAIHGGTTDLAAPIDKLSDRELEVLRHYGAQKTTRDIADHLHLSIKTVETHRAHLKEKLGLPVLEDFRRFAADWVSQVSAPPDPAHA